jgi:O-antigen ligase
MASTLDAGSGRGEHRRVVTTRFLGLPLVPRAVPRPGVALPAAGVAALAAAAAVAIGPAALALPVALAGGLFLVREPLALLTLYMYVGLFKEQAIVSAVPADVTLLLGLLLSCVCLARWASGRARGAPLGLIAPVAVIGVMLLVSLAWTPSPEYGGEKALKFVTLTLLAMLAPFFLVDDERDLRRYFSWTIAIAGVAALVAVANPPDDGGRLTIGTEGNTIGVSHLLCTAALILLVGALTELYRARRWAIVASVALIVVAAAIGSRGPLLSLGFALLATVTLFLARVPRKVAPVLVAVLAGVAIVPFVSLPESSAERLGQAARDPVGALEADPRYTAFEQAAELIGQDPLVGIGAGGFQSVGTLARPPEDYPHNMVLEVWSELGLVAVVVLVASVAAVLVGLWRGAWRQPPGAGRHLLYVLIGVFLFNLLETLVTGDLNGNRTFWGVFGLAWLVVGYGVPQPASPPVTASRRR